MVLQLKDCFEEIKLPPMLVDVSIREDDDIVTVEPTTAVIEETWLKLVDQVLICYSQQP